MERARGVDVSHWHPVSSWSLLAENASFIGIKATEALTFVDPTLKRHREGFRASSLELAIYFHFARTGDPVLQARRFAETVGELAPRERLCLDLEAEITDLAWVDAFFREIMGGACGGSRPLIYTSSRIWQTLGNPAWDLASEIDLWAPRYGTIEPVVPRPWDHWLIWQNNENARVPGIEGPCDTNVFAGDLEALRAYARPAPATPEPPQAA